MTSQEYHELDLTKLYEFTLYYNEILYGILVSDNEAKGIFFVVKPHEIKRYNENPRRVAEFGQKVLLNQIIRHQILNPNFNINTRNTGVIKKINAKKLVIFGAGASFDFTYNTKIKENEKPPLTYNLFSDEYLDILRNYRGAFNLSSEIQLSENLEDYFQKQWSKILATHDLPLLKKIVDAQYYLHHLFLEVSSRNKNVRENNYNILVTKAHEYCKRTNENVLFVSFNYDSLLEEAIENCTMKEFNSISDYINTEKNEIFLLKPHGSCNWIREISPGRNFALPFDNHDGDHISKCVYKSVTDYQDFFGRLEKEITLKNMLPNINQGGNNKSIYLPQILIPFKDKDDFVMPEEHTNFLENNLENIEDILIIGWKGTEAKFQEMLSKKLAEKKLRVSVVCNNDLTIIDSFKGFAPYSINSTHSTFCRLAKSMANESHFFSM